MEGNLVPLKRQQELNITSLMAWTRTEKIHNSDPPVPEKFYYFDVKLFFQFELSIFKCLFNNALSVVYPFYLAQM